MIEQLSIDLSNYCSKQCSFCYNHSTKDGNVIWQPKEVIEFASDCISHGVKAISLGGGEPFEYEGIFDIIDKLYSLCYITITSNGLPLEDDYIWKRLINSKPDKIHLTIHQPQDTEECRRVINRIKELDKSGIKPGVNLLVGKDNIEDARNAYNNLIPIITNKQIILVPQRFSNTPTSKQLASISGGRPFQSPSCLLGCTPPNHFASVSWDKKVNFCSFATSKVELKSLDFEGLQTALAEVQFKSCINIYNSNKS